LTIKLRLLKRQRMTARTTLPMTPSQTLSMERRRRRKRRRRQLLPQQPPHPLQRLPNLQLSMEVSDHFPACFFEFVISDFGIF
jgi:hypothetical protein